MHFLNFCCTFRSCVYSLSFCYALERCMVLRLLSSSDTFPIFGLSVLSWTFQTESVRSHLNWPLELLHPQQLALIAKLQDKNTPDHCLDPWQAFGCGDWIARVLDNARGAASSKTTLPFMILNPQRKLQRNGFCCEKNAFCCRNMPFPAETIHSPA